MGLQLIEIVEFEFLHLCNDVYTASIAAASSAADAAVDTADEAGDVRRSW